MWRRASLKQRLLVLALTAITLVWLGATAFTYHNARKEFDEVLDAHLAQAATLLVVQASHDLDELETEHAPLPHKYARRVAFQVWDKGHQLRLHSANAPQQPLANEERGFSDHTIDGHRWRVFSTWNESAEYLIQVAERADMRDELARGIAGNLLKPLFISLPLLAILLWIAVARGLRPLDKLTREVEQREPDNLAALDASSAPREVVPLIERLNRLFTRIEASMQKERRFTADAAHELRTPVAAIKAQAQVARAACSEAERTHALDNAILGCDRAAHLIDQLLTLARIDTLGNDVTEVCQLRVVAAEVIAAIAPAALSQHVRLELTEGTEVEVRCNPILLRILLRNLIDNAVRHTQPGTSVWVSITHQQGLTCLSVNDNGPGIPEAELTRVSERFYRPIGTSASGSGLGLSIVNRIAEIHGASLRIAPQNEGKGLSVTVIFKP
ncbi:ATP-binding protein [Candidatus Nitrotoga sp. 1052]|uniref:ATP-binding protein n=1 Tax=Candidatus Nitrotoga sp. 1052 TaxID=2886964 RepID=UPI001EF5FED4|nr:ATP-binding protein [Candidatus Nitrotoga sp. 1052]CAH1083183.1 Sensor protein QseC [Candidatus Nitrotoga sp. 1052]